MDRNRPATYYDVASWGKGYFTVTTGTPLVHPEKVNGAIDRSQTTG
jgi:hypothetical protein